MNRLYPTRFDKSNTLGTWILYTKGTQFNSRNSAQKRLLYVFNLLPTKLLEYINLNMNKYKDEQHNL